MAGKVWTVAFATAHRVELIHGTKSGSRTILVDGQEIKLGHDAKRFIDSGSVHQFSVDDRPLEVHIEPVGFGRWHYRLKADGDWLDPPLPKKTLPLWSFLFVALAVAPAVQVIRIDSSPIAIAICSAAAAGAAYGILANARDPLLSLERKVFKCGVLTALVWGALTLPSIMFEKAVNLLGG